MSPFSFSSSVAALLSIVVCSLVWPVLGGSCRGDGVFDGMGNFNGNGGFESEAGTFEGTGIFAGNNGSSFEGSAYCEFIARVQSVDNAQINVTGDGVFNGRGRFAFSGGIFEGEGEMEGTDITFVGVGTFDGEGTVQSEGKINVFGERFECEGNGVLAGDGSFEGEGSMRAAGVFVGNGSLNGSGSLLGRGSCSGNNVEFQLLSDGPETESIDEIEDVIESDLP